MAWRWHSQAQAAAQRPGRGRHLGRHHGRHHDRHLGAKARRRPKPGWLLRWALGLSLALHGGLLGLHFADPAGFDRVFRDSPLDVILVNARTSDSPQQAQALAQASLAGGGEASSGRATSPLPATGQVEIGNAPEETHRRVDSFKDLQQQLLASVQRELALLPPPDPLRDAGLPDKQDLEERRRQLLKLLAEIEKRINDDNAKPRKRYVSPATHEVPYAVYYDRLRRRIEERGTRDFPQNLGRKLYGELTMNITVDASGRVLQTEVVRGSGDKLLDRRAQAIVEAASPYGTFSLPMLQQADQIVVTSRFRFTRDDGLETTMSSARP